MNVTPPPSPRCYLLVLMVGGTIEKNGRRFRQRQEAMQYVRQYTQEVRACFGGWGAEEREGGRGEACV